jgi:hypothetical protein
MPLDIRSAAVSTAVVCFFLVSIVGSLGHLAPFTCCKRALLGAVVAYIAGGAAARTINAILTQAMVTGHVNKDKEKAGDSKN